MTTGSDLLLVTYLAPTIEKIEEWVLKTGGDDGYAITTVMAVTCGAVEAPPTSSDQAIFLSIDMVASLACWIRST